MAQSLNEPREGGFDNELVTGEYGARTQIGHNLAAECIQPADQSSCVVVEDEGEEAPRAVAALVEELQPAEEVAVADDGFTAAPRFLPDDPGANESRQQIAGERLDKLDARTVRLSDASSFLTPRPRASDADLNDFVAVAVDGDRHAIDHLLASIRPLVVRYCRARVGAQERSMASADDVAQEVCLAVLKALPSYRDQGRPFLAFVYGIAAHKVADAHRSAARNRAEPVPEVPDSPELSAGPEQRAMHAELSERMGALLRVLPEKQREILVLRVVVGLSAEETADAVGSTPGAVRVAQHRALARLRKTLSLDEMV